MQSMIIQGIKIVGKGKLNVSFVMLLMQYLYCPGTARVGAKLGAL